MKATPIPGSIEKRPGGLERAQCTHEGGPISRTTVTSTGKPLPWIHIETGRTTCGEKGI